MNYRTVGAEVKDMFGSIATRYDLTNTVLSGGLHLLWKKDFVKNIPVKAPGARMLDLCCGTGDLVPLIAKSHNAQVEGADFCEPMIEVARKRFPDFRFEIADAMNLPFQDCTFDGVTVSFGVRNFEDLEKGLLEIHRVLRPGGSIAVLEFGQPNIPIFSWVYNSYSRWIMPIVGYLLTGNRAAYEYLPRTVKTFPCNQDFNDILRRCNFSPKTPRPYMGGIAYGYYAVR